jgi:hypothetical protein
MEDIFMFYTEICICDISSGALFMVVNSYFVQYM